MTSRIGSYEILGELGRGVAGRVYRTRAPSGEDLALKLLVDSVAAGPNQRRRFEREAEALGRLSHPNVVRVRGVGEHQACPFLVMDLVDGESLQDRLDRDGPLDPRAAAEMAHGLALGLEYCHQCAVLHRDLKPANVLLAGSGRPLLTDFGLSKDLSASYSRISHTGTFMGTPGYWAPESAIGDLDRVGPGTDIYGLGATLYAALTGRPPIEAESLPAVLIATEETPPIPPSHHEPGVDSDLEAICLRCLEKKPDDRYASAAALARALERYLSGRPSPARARAKPQRAVPIAVGLIALGALGALGIVVSVEDPPPPVSPSASPVTAAPTEPAPPPDDLPDAAELVRLARGEAQRGDEERAIELCSQALALDGEHAPAWRLRGQLQGMLGRWDDSVEDLSQALARDDSDHTLWADRAHASSEIGRLEASIHDLTRAVEIEPRFAVGYHDRGIARETLGDSQGAIDDFTRAIVVDSTMSRAYLARGGALLNAGDAEGALQDSDHVIELDPGSATGHMNRGAALAQLNRKQEALESLTRSLELDPSRPLPWMNRGALRSELGDIEGGILDLGEALRLDPDNAMALLNRGIIQLEDMSDAAGALRDFEQAQARIPPGHPYAAKTQRLIEEAERRLGR